MITEGKTQQEIDESDERCVNVGNEILDAIDRVSRADEDLTLQEVSTAMATIIVKIYGRGEAKE